MSSSDTMDNVTLPETASSVPVPEPSRTRLAFRSHIKLLAFLVAVYALIFNRALHEGKQVRQPTLVKTVPIESSTMTASYIR